MGLVSSESSRVDPLPLPPIVFEILEQLEEDVLAIDLTDKAIFASEGIERLGVLRENKVQSPQLLTLIRVVRRTLTMQVGMIEMPRGPIGEGKHELTAKVLPLLDGNLVLALLSDESESQRIHEIRRDFVANISHELKTPIGALTLLSEAVLGAKDDPVEIVRFASRMQTEANRLTNLVQEIIDLSRIQDSDPLQDAREIIVSDLMKEAIDQCQIKAESRGVSITFNDEIVASVWGDKDQLTVALQNLIDNAINYSPENTKIALTSAIQGEIVEISVSDQGIGIPESDLERVFERFYRVDPARSRQTGGTGLGLSIVKHIAAKHGGDVRVWSTMKIGSTFTLMLPAHISTSEEI